MPFIGVGMMEEEMLSGGHEESVSSCYISQSVRDLIEDVKQVVEYASLKFREKTGLGSDILEIIRR